MLQRRVYTTALIAFFASVSLQAMDMDRVNEIVRQMKAAQGIVTPAVVEPVAAEAIPVPEVVVKKTAKVAVISVASAKGTISEESLGLRKTNLYAEKAETAPEATKYTADAPGASKRFDRAYENAPPMIPHSVDGLLPITQANNACLGCHMPEVAKSMGATPLPQTHFTNYRPTTVMKNGEEVKGGKIVGLKSGNLGNVGDIKLAKVKKLDHLYQGRYNCSQCHAPQSTQNPLVGNTFTPDFVTKDGASKSHLIDTINEGVN